MGGCVGAEAHKRDPPAPSQGLGLHATPCLGDWAIPVPPPSKKKKPHHSAHRSRFVHGWAEFEQEEEELGRFMTGGVGCSLRPVRSCTLPRSHLLCTFAGVCLSLQVPPPHPPPTPASGTVATGAGSQDATRVAGLESGRQVGWQAPPCRRRAAPACALAPASAGLHGVARGVCPEQTGSEHPQRVAFQSLPSGSEAAPPPAARARLCARNTLPRPIITSPGRSCHISLLDPLLRLSQPGIHNLINTCLPS